MVNGRGAWNVSGAGGTLQSDKAGGTKPGPYYMLAVAPDKQVGSGGIKSTDLSTRAVNYGVRAIQRGINRAAGTHLLVDGIYGAATTKAVNAWQAKQPAAANTGVWGGVGQDSAKALFTPWLRDVVPADKFKVVYGITGTESSWDPGAVGYADPNDLGLEQINGPSNPSLDEAARFDPEVAFLNASARYAAALVRFDGDVRTAVASYNLGLGGAASWERAGSPEWWTPAGASKARDVWTYIDKILNAYDTDHPRG